MRTPAMTLTHALRFAIEGTPWLSGAPTSVLGRGADDFAVELSVTMYVP